MSEAVFFFGFGLFVLMGNLAAALDFTHRPAVFNGLLRQLELFYDGEGQQRTGMPHFQAALVKHFLHGFGQA